MTPKSRPLLWSLLVFMLGLLGTMLLASRQQTFNNADAQWRFATQASENANQIVERIFRFQYGLRGIQGAILGADAQHLSHDMLGAFRTSPDMTLEFNGAKGFGYLEAQSGSTPWVESLDDSPPATLRALLTSDAAIATAHAAWVDQAPTLSGPLHPGSPAQDLLVLLPAQPRTAEGAPALKRPGWVYVIFDVRSALVDLIPQEGANWLAITDVTPGTHGGQIVPPRTPRPTTWPFHWQSTREVLGRRWLIEARADAHFARQLNQVRPSAIGWIGLGLSTLLAALSFALTHSRQRRLKLRRQEAQLAAVVRHTSDAVITHDRLGRILSWNQAAERIFGISASQMLGRHWSVLLRNAWDEAQDRHLMASVASGQAASNIDTVLQAADGTAIDVSMSVVALSEAHEPADTLCRTIRDNRERKAAEARLRDLAHDLERQVQGRTAELAVASRQSEALLETMQLHGLYSVTDRRGTIIDVNEAFCQISGYSRQELIGQTHHLVNSGVHPKAFWADMWRTIARGRPWRGEVCNRAKDGSLYWVDSLMAPFRGADGHIEKYISLRSDITARKLAEERLRASSEGFVERAGQMAGVGGWELDLATGDLVLTRQTRVIFGIDESHRLKLEEALGFFPTSARELVRHAIHDAVRINKGWDLELPFVDAAGNKLWVRMQGGVEHVAVDEEGRPGRLVGALQDVTTRHLTEQALLEAKRHAEEASLAKTEFLANMSHEIRTPLNAVLGMTHLLRTSLRDAEQRDWVTKIQSASQSLLAVLNDVLDLSKIEAGELQLEQTPFSLRRLIKDVESLFVSQALSKSLSFAISVPDDIPDAVIGDPLRLRQVLVNLLSNAFKFTEQGRIQLSCRVQARSDAGVDLRFTIADTGLGMSPDTLSRLFEPFTQADASTTRRFGGTGLGLSIVRRLVTLMSGELGVNSQEGAGSQFWFVIPLTLAPDDSVSDTATGGWKVWVVGNREDEQQALLKLSQSLGWQGLPVQMGEGDSALQDLDPEHPLAPPDLVLIESVLATSLWWRDLSHHWIEDDSRPPTVILQYDPADRTGATTDLPHPWTALNLYNAVARAAWPLHASTQSLWSHTAWDTLSVRQLEGVRLLVVDDSDINLEVALRILRNEGADAEKASNGLEALQKLTTASLPFDAVLMDIQMPVMDGIEATHTLRLRPELSTLPVIALTAGALTADRQRAIEVGMTDFASKPLVPLSLIQVIRRHVEQSRQQSIPVQADLARVDSLPMDWPSLPGVDAPRLAREWGQDPAFYRSQLRRFVDEYADTNTPPHDLKTMLHKLAGTAGVLCLKTIGEQARLTEQCLAADPHADVIEAWQGIVLALQDLSRAAQPWLAPSDPITSPVISLPDWMAALASHRLEASVQFEGLKPTLATRVAAADWQPLCTAMSQLDYDQALAILRRHLPEALQT
ncbi:MAG: PAS domain S-box protein [Burkholderiales bacterium]|nr:PAS domain S-box protein [Burkholderiales bacterium]